MLPTGGGKSLCFQAPALVRPGLALVVSPLISLMKDQVDTLTANGVAAACFNSSLPADERASVLQGIREGRYRLLYVSPERLAGENSESFIANLARSGVSFIAVDEAHCISQWGHDFRPEYRQLARLRQAFPGVSLHAYTATATARVRGDIAAQLALREPLELVGSFDRPNLVYRVLSRAQLKRQILDVLGRHRGHAGIIYCTSRREVDALAAWLSDTGVRAVAVSRRAERRRAQPESGRVSRRARRRRRGDRGVRHGHRSLRRALRRARGRAAVARALSAGVRPCRPRRPRGRVRAVYSTADFLKWRVMLERNGELTDARRGLLRDMERYAASVGCRHKHLLGYFGEHDPRTDCGACDYCLDELEAVAEPVVVARKVLSCVARVGQRFGAAHVTNVLRGSETDQVTARGHAALTTFGLLRDATRAGGARLHRAARRASPAAPDRRRVSGAGADRLAAWRC